MRARVCAFSSGRKWLLVLNSINVGKKNNITGKHQQEAINDGMDSQSVDDYQIILIYIIRTIPSICN